MTEQEATDKLETLVGSHDRCFRLMRLYKTCESSISPTRYSLSRRKSKTVEGLFLERAQAEHYPLAAIEHYLDYIR